MRTIDTKNNDYFERFEFFRLYPKKLPEIVRGSDSSIYQIRWVNYIFFQNLAALFLFTNVKYKIEILYG